MVNKEAGKGDSYRPVNKKIYDANFETIFGKPNGVIYYSKREKKIVTIPKVKGKKDA